MNLTNQDEEKVYLLERFKYSNYPKIEVIRKEISRDYVCKKEKLIAIATDLACKFEGIKTININDVDEVLAVLLRYIEEA